MPRMAVIPPASHPTLHRLVLRCLAPVGSPAHHLRPDLKLFGGFAGPPSTSAAKLICCTLVCSRISSPSQAARGPPRSPDSSISPYASYSSRVIRRAGQLARLGRLRVLAYWDETPLNREGAVDFLSVSDYRRRWMISAKSRTLSAAPAGNLRASSSVQR